jgi:iron complex outermembrane recepter protein
VSRGDAVGGVPAVAAPWSVYGSARYELPLAPNLSGYIMVQESLHSQNPGPFSTNNPASSSNYFPGLHADPTISDLRLQSGLQWPHLEIRLVADNVLDTHPVLQQYSDAPGSGLFYANTVRPRTVGVSGTWSF